MENKKFIDKLNTKSIAAGFVLWVLPIIVIASYGAIAGKRETIIWPAIIVVQFAASILWLIARLGGFSMFSSGVKGTGAAVMNRKYKLGSYQNEERKVAPKPYDVEIKARDKSKQGIITALVLTILELIIVLPIIL